MKGNKKIKAGFVVLLGLPVGILILIAWTFLSYLFGPKIFYQQWHSVVWDYDDVCAVNVDGSWNRKLSIFNFNSSHLASYSPDGNNVVYVNQGSIKIMSVNGFFAETLDSGKWPSFSPDGRSIVYISDKSILCTIDIDGKNRRELIDLRDESVWSPEFSPDGQKIIFKNSRDDKNYKIGVYDLTTSKLTRIASIDVSIYDECFYRITLEGDKIFYNNGNIHVVGLDGKDHFEMKDTDNEYFVLSPDGEMLYYMQAINKDEPSSPCRLCSIQTDGTNRSVLVEDCYPGNVLDLSVDGQVLTFLEGDALMTMHADGTDKKQVVTIEEVGGSGSILKAVNFTPDGKQLILTVWKDTGSAGTTDLYAVNIDGSNIIQLTKMEEDNNALLKGFSPYGW